MFLNRWAPPRGMPGAPHGEQESWISQPWGNVVHVDDSMFPMYHPTTSPPDSTDAAAKPSSSTGTRRRRSRKAKLHRLTQRSNHRRDQRRQFRTWCRTAHTWISASRIRCTARPKRRREQQNARLRSTPPKFVFHTPPYRSLFSCFEQMGASKRHAGCAARRSGGLFFTAQG